MKCLFSKHDKSDKSQWSGTRIQLSICHVKLGNQQYFIECGTFVASCGQSFMLFESLAPAPSPHLLFTSNCQPSMQPRSSPKLLTLTKEPLMKRRQEKFSSCVLNPQAGLESGRPIEIGEEAQLDGGRLAAPACGLARSVIRAGSVVIQDIPEGIQAIGNPCRVV
jgi:hypothetical protein